MLKYKIKEVAPAAAPEAPATPELQLLLQSAPVAEEAPAQPAAVETAAAPEVQPVASTPTTGNAIPTDPNLQPQAEASVKKLQRNSVSQTLVVTVQVIQTIMVKGLQWT